MNPKALFVRESTPKTMKRYNLGRDGLIIQEHNGEYVKYLDALNASVPQDAQEGLGHSWHEEGWINIIPFMGQCSTKLTI